MVEGVDRDGNIEVLFDGQENSVTFNSAVLSLTSNEKDKTTKDKGMI